MIIVLMFVFVSGLSAETFVFAESYRTFKKDEALQTNVVWGQQSLNKRVGAFGWGQYGKTYQQTYGGLYVKPLSWFQVGAATGQEQWSKTPRLGSFAYAANGKYRAFAIYENYGKTGYWYLLLTDMKLNSRWGIGTHSQAFFGHGPRVEYRFKPVHGWTPSIRFATGWSKTSIRPSFILGLRLTYFKGE